MDGELLATSTLSHEVRYPRPGHVEMDASVWWRECVGIIRGLLGSSPGVDVEAIGVSGMGPCTLLADEHGEPLRPAILYGVDTRASAQIEQLNSRYGAASIVERCRSALSSQAVGPKLAWVADHEPDVFARARRLLMPSSYLVAGLTGAYVLDHHSASQSVPLYDPRSGRWHEPWWDELAGPIAPPRLCWSGHVAGSVTVEAAAATGLRPGTPVTAGTVDAWAEAISVDAHNPGDLMLMYGTTMFLVGTVTEPLSAPPLWGTVGLHPGSHNLAGGMATSGAITAWLRDLVGGGAGYDELAAAAEAAGPGARGLAMLPYFAGERTPIDDADARGVVAGLTLSHTAGDLYRAALEATAMGVRHNLEAFTDAGASIEQVVAVGGGTQSRLWAQIVSDVTGRHQRLHAYSVGASYGSARLAAGAIGIDTGSWNAPTGEVEPNRDLADDYDELYRLYRELYATTRELNHALASRQRRASEPTGEATDEHLPVP